MVQNSEYWEERIANEAWKTYNDIEEKNIDLLKMYEKTSNSIKKELLALAEKAEKEGVLGRTEQYRFNKLLGQQGAIFKECERLGEQIEKHATSNMKDGGANVYNNVMESLGISEFATPNKKAMEQMMRSPWKGSFFSERLWRDMGKLERNLNGVINDGISTGKTITEMAVSLSNIMNSSFNDTHRLVRTETINHMNRSAMKGYKDAGIKEVQWWAAVDERTCPKCGAGHRKSFDIDKAPILPCHPGCRCTWLPAVNETKEVAKKSESSTMKLKNNKVIKGYSNFEEMDKYCEQNYNIKIDESVHELDFLKCRDAFSGIESLFSDFHELSTNIKGISTNSSGVMSCNGNMIYFNPTYFKEGYDLADICGNQANSGWWVKNASISSIGVHETGHAIEQILINLNETYEFNFQRVLAWNDGIEAKAIVREAIKNIKKTPYGKSKKKDDLLKEISSYASKSEQEAMAESFADVYANGKEANNLSIEIKKIVIEKYNKYKGD